MSSKGQGKKVRVRFAVIIVIVLVVAAFGMRFAAISQVEDVDSIESIHQKEGRPVETVTVSRGDLMAWTTLAGTVEGIVQYPIVSTNSIQVMDVLRKEGDWVNAGDIVIRLEKAAANPMLHSYERSRVLYEDALRDVRRMRDLFKEGAVSQQVLDKSEMALKIAESDLRNAREGIDLVADYAGTVTSLLVERGDMANNGSTLAWIARTDTVKVEFYAGSRQAAVLEKGQRAVWSIAGTGKGGEGTIRELDLAADPKSHLLRGEAIFPNNDGDLLPGLLVSFKVLSGDRRGVMKIPTGALLGNGLGSSVFVVTEDQQGMRRAVLTEVETGLRTSDEIEIVSGLSDGDLVVFFGQSKLHNGDLVKITGGEEE